MLCQRREGAVCSLQTEGFSPSVAVSVFLRTGLVLSGPDCLAVGVIFCFLVCQCLCLHTQLLQKQEWFGSGVTFKGHLLRPPCSEWGHFQLDKVAQSSLQPDLEYLQG